MNKFITWFFGLNVFIVYIMLTIFTFGLSVLAFHDFENYNLLGELIFAITISVIGALSFWANKRTYSFDKMYNKFMYDLELVDNLDDLKIMGEEYTKLTKAFNEEQYQFELVKRAKRALDIKNQELTQ